MSHTMNTNLNNPADPALEAALDALAAEDIAAAPAGLESRIAHATQPMLSANMPPATLRLSPAHSATRGHPLLIRTFGLRLAASLAIVGTIIAAIVASAMAPLRHAMVRPPRSPSHKTRSTPSPMSFSPSHGATLQNRASTASAPRRNNSASGLRVTSGGSQTSSARRVPHDHTSTPFSRQHRLRGRPCFHLRRGVGPAAQRRRTPAPAP